MRLRNRHTAPIDGIAPGEIGDFDSRNPAVKAWIEHGYLVDIERPEAGDDDPLRLRPTHEQGLEMLAEIDRRGARVGELEEATRARDARIAALEAELAGLKDKGAKPKKDG